MEGEFGHFARVFINVDLSSELPTSLLIEMEGLSYFIKVKYEKHPYFCAACSSMLKICTTHVYHVKNIDPHISPH